MMLLQSAERARDFATLDPTSGRLEFFSEDGAQRERLQSTLNGRFSLIEGIFIALYRQNGDLKLRLGDKEHIVDDMTSSRIDERRGRLASLLPAQLADRVSNVQNEFNLIRNGENVASLIYSPPSASNIAFDPTPFVEKEDFDFMLFIHHVLTESERRKNIWAWA
jgi:hypothetical protein